MIGADVEAKSKGDAAKAVDEAVQEALTDVADAGFSKSQEKVASQSTDTGQLLKSGIPPHTPLSDRNTIQWGYAAPYAPYVEYGTHPHYPPIEPLLGWARRVLGDESAAYAVQEKIGQEGTPPQPFIRPGIEEMRRRLRKMRIGANIDDNL